MIKTSNKNTAAAEPLLPSEFMRTKRPYLYSDGERRSAYHLDRDVFRHHLETLGTRKQESAFEHFARKLCQKTLCPSIRPHTGPDGGGDGKTDAESVAVAPEIRALWYVGEAGAGEEEWAFAFSTKKRWTQKARTDVDGIVSCGRPFAKIYFVTSCNTRSKKRAEIEKELSEVHKIPVRVLDRSWIVEEVFDRELFSLAYDYLGVGTHDPSKKVIGPNDFRRQQELEELERDLADPETYQGVEYQRLADALHAAMLSRELQGPRVETVGRFERAIDLARRAGAATAELRARYEYAWTHVWWFDDFEKLNELYDPVETMALPSMDAHDLERVCNLFQVLFAGVRRGHLNADDTQFVDREDRLREALQRVAGGNNRPNNALQAVTSLLVLDINNVMNGRDEAAIPDICARFSDVIARARPLGEYPAQRLDEFIDLFGSFAGAAPEYAALVEEVAEFFAERESQGRAGQTLLKLARHQLDREQALEAVRTLGKACIYFVKDEYRPELFEALYLIAIAYQALGLNWAARGACLSAAVAASRDLETGNEVRIEIVPTVKLLADLALRLGHVPDVLRYFDFLNTLGGTLPLDEASKDRVADDLAKIDFKLAGIALSAGAEELTLLRCAPDMFGALGLDTARACLLYAMGHEPLLREEGSVEAEMSSEAVEEQFGELASTVRRARLGRDIITNTESRLCYRSTVLGVEVNVECENSERGSEVCEAVLTSLESFAATMLDRDVIAHTQNFSIHVELSDSVDVPSARFEDQQGRVVLAWPKALSLTDYEHSSVTRQALVETAVLTISAIAFLREDENLLEELAEHERVFDRAVTFSVSAASYQRLFGRFRSTLDDWQDSVQNGYLIMPDRPLCIPSAESGVVLEARSGAQDTEERTQATRHSDLAVLSVIDVHLWQKASWQGVGFVTTDGHAPPLLGLVFSDLDAGAAIVRRWVERFGPEDQDESIGLSFIFGISTSNPHWYRVQIAPSEELIEAYARNNHTVSIATRDNTMTPNNNENLQRFLQDFHALGSYYVGACTPDPQYGVRFEQEHAIRKTQLQVVNAWEISGSDVALMAVRDDDDVVIPEDRKHDAPIIKTLSKRRGLRDHKA